MEKTSRIWLIVAVQSACLSAALISIATSVFNVIETRRAVSEMVAATGAAKKMQEQIGAVMISMQRSQTGTVAFTGAGEVPAPLPKPAVWSEPRELTARVATRRVEHEEKAEIPENGKFTFISDDPKAAKADQPRLKLLGDK